MLIIKHPLNHRDLIIAHHENNVSCKNKSENIIVLFIISIGTVIATYFERKNKCKIKKYLFFFKLITNE